VAKVTVNTGEVDRMFEDLEIMTEEVMKEGYKYFRNQTPIRGGNARNRTKLEKKHVIGARYGYAERLDEGWSKQSPKGMTEPTSNELDKLVGNYIKRVT
jgi:hypothetical protein